MARLFLMVLGISGLVAGCVYLALAWWSAPHRRLLREYDRMRGMILDAVDDVDRPRAEQLLEDCRDHLQGLIRSRQRLEALDDMADAAADFADLDAPSDRRELEEHIREEMESFIDEMTRIAAEVDHDWRGSIQRLESFTDELREQREAFAELEDLSER